MGEQDRFRQMVARLPPEVEKFAPREVRDTPPKPKSDTRELALWMEYLKYRDMLSLCRFIMEPNPPTSAIELADKLSAWAEHVRKEHETSSTQR